MARRMSERRPQRRAQKDVRISLASITRIIAIVLLIVLVAFLAIHKSNDSFMKKTREGLFFYAPLIRDGL